MTKFDKNGKLLHLVFRSEDLCEIQGRIDLSQCEEFLQVAALKIPKHKTFEPHIHIKNERVISKTQECWVVVRGLVEATYYDEDRELVGSTILTPGDVTITFHGGHNYRSLEKDTLVYEIKNGPYFGRSRDKEIIK